MSTIIIPKTEYSCGFLLTFFVVLCSIFVVSVRCETQGTDCKVIRYLTRVPTGTNFTVPHPDGEIFEYGQHH